jgi:hypothetical protein
VPKQVGNIDILGIIQKGQRSDLGKHAKLFMIGSDFLTCDFPQRLYANAG